MMLRLAFPHVGGFGMHDSDNRDSMYMKRSTTQKTAKAEMLYKRFGNEKT